MPFDDVIFEPRLQNLIGLFLCFPSCDVVAYLGTGKYCLFFYDGRYVKGSGASIRRPKENSLVSHLGGCFLFKLNNL